MSAGGKVWGAITVLVVATLIGSTLSDFIQQRIFHRHPSGTEVLVPLGICSVTSYTNRPEETDDTPNWTSISEKVRLGGVAVSQDWLKKKRLVYGDVIFIPEMGQFFTVNDCMNERWTRRFDIFMFDVKASDRFGLKHMNIYLVRED